MWSSLVFKKEEFRVYIRCLYEMFHYTFKNYEQKNRNYMFLLSDKTRIKLKS